MVKCVDCRFSLLIVILALAAVAIFSQVWSQRKLRVQHDGILGREKEKELLLKEVHHRVKNNLQIIIGLLELQSIELDDDRFATAIVEGQNRVKSMALIHQKLYQVNELATIDVNDHVHSLIRELATVYRSEKTVQHRVNCEGIILDIDTAIPLGLMLSELISNSYKYAMNKVENPAMEVPITKQGGGEYLFFYSDNGPGLPADFSLASTTTLGVRLVKRLTQYCLGLWS